MQLIELRAEMLTVSAEMMRLVEMLRRVELELADSHSTPAADCATTQTARSAGDGSAPPTTGLTDAQIRSLFWECANVGALHLEMTGRAECTDEMTAHLRFYLDSLLSATGGQQPQPRPSDLRPDNWPSASSDPTSPREHSAPTQTPMSIDWSAVRRTAEDRLRTLWGESSMDSATMRTTMDAVMESVEEAFKGQSRC